MEDISYSDVRAHFLRINDKLAEFIQIQNERDDQLNVIKDETDQVVNEHDKIENERANEWLSNFGNGLDAAYNYATQLINNIQRSQTAFDSKVPNVFVFQERGKQNASTFSMDYSMDYHENVRQLEWIDEQISRKISICTQNEGSLFGFGKKLVGMNDSLYEEVYTMFYRAYAFYNGLESQFDRIFEAEKSKIDYAYDQYYNSIGQNVKVRVAEIDRICNEKVAQWKQELIKLLDKYLPLSYLENQEKNYAEAMHNFGRIPDENARHYIPAGRIYLDLTSIEVEGWEDIQNIFRKKYGKYMQDDYLWCNAAWNIEENRSLIFADYGQEGADKYIKDELESTLYKNIVSILAGNFYFTVCSASGLIPEYRWISRFITEFPQISGEKIITEKQEIMDVLDAHLTLLNDIVQKKLVGYTGIEEFNRKNPNQKIPYRCLCITGFPAGFDETMLTKVSRLMQQGHKAGIQVILSYEDKYFEEGRGESWMKPMREIMTSNVQLEWTGKCWTEALCHSIFMWLFKMPFEKEGYSVFEDFKKHYAKEMNKVLEMTDLIAESERFKSYSGDLLRIPIGVNEQGTVQYLEMGDPVANGTSHYAIIAGPTGSGKSTLLHTIIMGSLLSYTAEEIELYMMDFKEGNEFKIYEGKKIPQIKCIALDAMQDFGESILDRLWQILEERNEKFTAASRNGVEIKNIADYRKAGHDMPRILVIIDEFQVLFDRDQNKRVADRCASRMSDFISRARVYGIHFIFATQTMHKLFEGGSSISKSTLEEMHIRIGLQCQPKEMEYLFGEINYNECLKKRSERKGSAIYLENDIVSKPVGMQVAYMKPELQQSVLEKIEEYFSGVEYNPAIIFRGDDEPVFSKKNIFERPDSQTTVYLGRPISISDDVGITVSRKRRSNLLVAGEDQEMLDRISALWLVQASDIQKDSDVYLFDGAEMVGETALHEKAHNVEEVICIDNVFRVIPVMNEIYDIYDKRKRNMIKGIKDPDDKKKIHVIISNYQWIEPVMRLMERKSVSEFEFEEEKPEESALGGLMSMLQENSGSKSNMNPSQKVYTLLESGYLCGIQIVMTCSDFGLLKKLTSTELLPFTNRIILKTSSAIYSLIDTDINMKSMRENTVIYSDGIHTPYLFKPYKISEE